MSYKNNQEKSKGMTRRVKDMAIIVIDNNNNNNINKRENEMTSFNEIVASKIKTGLTKESDKITEIGRVLVEMGKSRTERIWLLSHDEDFIPDVLSCYNHKECHRNCRDTEYGFFLAAR